MDLPEENQMWKEKQEIENPKVFEEEEFIPAKEVEESKDEDVLIRVLL